MPTNSSNELISISKQLQKLPPQEQMTAILKHAKAQELVRSLPPEELLLTINQVGLDDSLELIELLSSDQLKTMFDLDVWQHESVDNESLTKWLQALQSANPSVALEQMRELDFEFLTMMLRDCAEIYDLIENEDPYFESELILYTSDRHYLIAFKTDDEHEVQSHFLKALIDEMMGRDFLTAIRLIESARWETQSLLHEDALRLRDGRLQDLGFLPHSEARSILTFVDIDKMKGSSSIPAAPNEHTTALHWHYQLPSLNGLPFLREALMGLSHAALEDNWNYIVTVANRVHMAQTGKYSDAEAVNESARYTLNFIEMALAYLSGGNLQQAKHVFLSHSPQDLFKAGHSLVLRLQRDFIKLRQHPAFSLAATSLPRLDAPLLEVARGILQPEPLFFAGLTDPKRVDYRPFENLRDVAQTSNAMSEIAFRCALLGPKGLAFKEPDAQALTSASLGVLLATYISQYVLTGHGSFKALSSDQFQNFFEQLEKTPSGKQISNPTKSLCIEHLQDVASSLVGLVGIRTLEDAQAKTATYANIVFGLIESELSGIKDLNPDPRFITSLLVR